MFEKVTIIANPISGGRADKRKIIDLVHGYFSQKCRACTLNLTTKQGAACELSRLAVDEKTELVVVVGGDGTINEAANALVHTGIPMGIIPVGSGNGLARSLGIPMQVKKACDVILNGTVRTIDAGQVNQRTFCLILGVGFDAAVGHRFATFHKRGPASYFYLSAREFLNYRPEPLTLKLAGRQYELAPFLVAVANGPQYGNNAVIAPGAFLNDGLLDICIVREMRFSQLLKVLPKLFSGRLEQADGIEMLQAASLSIVRSGPGLLNIDGEACQEAAELHISLAPQALHVITPESCPALV